MSLQALAAYLTRKVNCINGKKAFQKYMYFLDAEGVPTQLNFRIHYFGPYSSELDYQSDNLELMGAIKIEPSKGFGFAIYPGDNTTRILEQERAFIEKYQSKIDKVIQVLPKEPRALELWSTTHFVASSLNQFYGGYTKEKVVTEVKKIKQDKFTEQEIENAFNKLKEMNFLP